MLYCFYPLTAIFTITPEWPGTWSRVGVSGERVRADVMEGHLEVLKENFLQKCFRIFRRFGRMWRYRSLASESYWLMVWNTFSFSSYLKRKVKL